MSIHAAQKYILHPLTAFFFAFATARFVSHYQLIEFPYAALVSAGLIFLSYLFLSQKYEPSLSYIFLLIATFILYKGVFLPKRISVSESTEQVLETKLFVLASAVKTYYIDHGVLPTSLDGIQISMVPGSEFYYCIQKSCKKDVESLFVIEARSKKSEEFLSIDDEFVISKNQTGDIIK